MIVLRSVFFIAIVSNYLSLVSSSTVTSDKYETEDNGAKFVNKILGEDDIKKMSLQLENVISHPLDPLSRNEIRMASDILKKLKPDINWSFNTITLKEPAKKILYNFYILDLNPPVWLCARRAKIVASDKKTNEYFEVIVNINSKSIENFRKLNGSDTIVFTDDETDLAINISRKDPEVVKRSAQLGYFNMSLVFASLWSIGYIGDEPEFANRRLGQILFFGQKFPEDNIYAHPFPFLGILDFGLKKIIELRDFPTHFEQESEPQFSSNDAPTFKNNHDVKVPQKSYNYDFDLRAKEKEQQNIKPIIVSMPKGNSFEVRGYQIKWQKFKMHIGFNEREGLVINQVSYKDGNEIRPILYRASVSEMFVPYGDPRFPYYMKTVFDEGEFGLGMSSLELSVGSDCLGSVHFFNGTYSDDDGSGVVKQNVICVSEEDGGVLWKHKDELTNKVTQARSRRLVISTAARLGNYEYLFYWYFYQDASIQFEVKLTGILITQMIATNSQSPPYGHSLDETLIAPIHQHLFCVRLDLDVDGPINSIGTKDVQPLPHSTFSKENPIGNGMVQNLTILKKVGGSFTAPLKNRVWQIFNKMNKKSKKSGSVPSYILKPANSQPLLLHEDSPIRRKAEFGNYDLWTTRYVDGQIYASGEYLNRDGLLEWTEADKNSSIEETDLVFWHTFSTTHVPRSEDWPLMPVESVGFWLKPVNFFKENPSLGIPRSSNSLKEKNEL